MMPDRNDDLMLQAYLDGELDPAAMLQFEQRLADDAALRAQLAQLKTLRAALRSLPQADMPKSLRVRVTAAVDKPREIVAPVRNNVSWRALAAAVVVGAVISSGAMVAFDQYRARQDVVRQVVASHARGLLAPQPFDIASSDRHTVKPWFTTKIAESPQVVDLAEDGFALIGGRIDVVDGEPVATIVYRHANHVVSLTVLRGAREVRDDSVSGYRVRSWREGNLTYVAVCDLPAPDLAAFQRAFIAKNPG